MARTPLLTLDTLVERDTVVIDGKPYELKSPGELSLLEYHRIGKHAEALEVLGRKDEYAEDEVEAVSAALDEAVRIFLVAPADVISRLRFGHKQALLRAFTNADAGIRATAPAVAAAAPVEAVAAPSTGASMSPGSSGSTAGIQPTGSRARRKRSSRPA